MKEERKVMNLDSFKNWIDYEKASDKIKEDKKANDKKYKDARNKKLGNQNAK